MPITRETVEVWVFTCRRCQYRWTPRKPLTVKKKPKSPARCPACHTALWDTERTREIADENKARRRDK